MANPLKVKPVLRLFTCLCIFILAAFAITTIALYAETRKIAHRYPADDQTPWRGPSDDAPDGDSVYYWPDSILYSADRLVVGAGILSLITALSSLISCFVLGSEIVCSLLGLASLGTSMGALIHSMDWHSKYGRLAYDGAFYGVQSDIYQQYLSTFTLERWTCELKDFLVFLVETNDYTDMCNHSKAFRYMTIPLFIFSIFLLVMMYLLYADRKKQERETVGEENGEISLGALPEYVESKGTVV